MAEGRRFLLRFALRDDVRFLSHLDLMRLMERACRRAGLPLRFSGKFNPRPMVHLPVPHAVGTGGEDEPLLLEFDAPQDADALPALLTGQLPPGAPVLSARCAEPREKFRPEWVEYRCRLTGPSDGPGGAEGPEPAALAALAERLRAGEAVTVRRGGGDARHPARSVDIGRFVLSVSAAGRDVFMRVAVTDAGSARPEEILSALGLSEAARQAETVRTAVHLRSVFAAEPVAGSAEPARVADGAADPTSETWPGMETTRADADADTGAEPEGSGDEFAGAERRPKGSSNIGSFRIPDC